jgi:hypothetical protein
MNLLIWFCCAQIFARQPIDKAIDQDWDNQVCKGRAVLTPTNLVPRIPVVNKQEHRHPQRSDEQERVAEAEHEPHERAFRSAPK